MNKRYIVYTFWNGFLGEWECSVRDFENLDTATQHAETEINGRNIVIILYIPVDQAFSDALQDIVPELIWWSGAAFVRKSRLRMPKREKDQ